LLSAALGGLALLVAAGLPAPAGAAGCGLLGLEACPPPPAPAPDPGGDENASPPVPAPGTLVGFSSNLSADSSSGVSSAKEYDLARAAGANAGRIDVFWSYMEPGPPTGGVHRYSGDGPLTGYADSIDTRYTAMRARGIRPILILHSAPPWAQYQGGLLGLGKCTSDCFRFVEPAAERMADWDAFARFIARRYPDAAYEIWNEPNVTHFYRPAPNPTNYLRLYLVAYRAIRAVNTSADVLSGGLAALLATKENGISLKSFLGSLYQQGLKGQAPAFELSVHAYPGAVALGAGSRFATQWAALVDQMKAAQDMTRRVWVTETGISTSPVTDQGNPSGPQGLVATLDQQRDIMRRSYARMVTMDSVGDPARRVNVHAVLFHTLKEDSRSSPTEVEYGYGFLKNAPWLAPKPAFCWMVRATPPGASPRSYTGC
jgi:hypothetical protein